VSKSAAWRPPEPQHGPAGCARDVMSGESDCVREEETIEAAAKRLADLNVGAVPIRGEDDRFERMITDRGITTRMAVAGKHPAQRTAGSWPRRVVVTIGADDSVDERVAHDDREEGSAA
jgi:predicted transcriptional regulator